MRLRLVKDDLNWDFFSRSKLWLGISGVMVVIALASFFIQGLNYGIDFRGGTTIRTESAEPVDVGAYRDALAPLGLGDTVISEVFDPNFRDDQNVATVRIGAQDGEEAVSTEVIDSAEAALKEVAPDIRFTSVESVGPKVSQELIHICNFFRFGYAHSSNVFKIPTSIGSQATLSEALFAYDDYPAI